jgi:hypothetical protein
LLRPSTFPRWLAAVALCAGLGAATGAAAQPELIPTDAENVDVFLLTVGRGPEVYANYGHTILRILDKTTGADLNFNWGIFDFRAPGFAWKFYKGNLRYQMAIMDFGDLVRHYRQIERRSVVQDRINLTTAQKAKLLERVAWNAQPENVEYDYNQFWNNCATKPRDYLDEALGGRIKARYGRPSHMTFRPMIRRSTAAAAWAYLGLDMVTNDRFDMPILQWDEMFLPAKLREHLRELPAFDDAGTPVAGQNLLGDSRVIVDLPEARDETNPYFLVMLCFGLPLVALLVGATRAEGKARARLLGVASLLFGLWAGVWGTLMLANWLLSSYPEGKHNAGLWLLWPLDWVFVAYGVTLLRKQEVAPWRTVDYLAKAHLAGLALVTVIWLAGCVRQDVSAMLSTSGVLALCLYGTLVALRPRKGAGA